MSKTKIRIPTPKTRTNLAQGRVKRAETTCRKMTAKRMKSPGDKKEKRVSALDAAATVLKRKGRPMQCAEIIAEMSKHGLWSSPAGKTPAATLYSALLREITKKGRNSRFKKIERGKFVFNKV